MKLLPFDYKKKFCSKRKISTVLVRKIILYEYGKNTVRVWNKVRFIKLHRIKNRGKIAQK